jgi:all-trans-retinol 13,14-reductase
VDLYEVGTAKTIEWYTLNPGGNVYGFSQVPSQDGPNRLLHESPIENLYFASAWTQPGGGFGAVLGSGYMVATGSHPVSPAMLFFNKWGKFTSNST